MFLLQAEDGIRGGHVTGVQTCALPIYLPVIHTVQPPEDFDGGAWTGEGTVINSRSEHLDIDGLDVPAAKDAVTTWLQEQDKGSAAVTYRLRDWLFSRQRYWGEPLPVVYDDDGRVIPLPH